MKHPRPDDDPCADSWPDPATAEALLNGEAVEGVEGVEGTESAAGTWRLARLLAAAAEPLPGRPADERAALDAFRLTRVPARPAAAHRRRPRTAKVLVAGLAAVIAFSGAALAAQTGALPHPFRSAPAATATSPSTARTTSDPSALQPTAARNPPPAPAPPRPPRGTPRPSVAPKRRGAPPVLRLPPRGRAQTRRTPAPLG